MLYWPAGVRRSRTRNIHKTINNRKTAQYSRVLQELVRVFIQHSMEEIVWAEGRGLGEDEGVGSGTEVIGIWDRREEKLGKDMGMGTNGGGWRVELKQDELAN